jgi:hypothetical protein
MEANVTFTPMKGNGLACSIRSPQGRSLNLSGVLTDIEPISKGDPAMARNRALVHNLSAYGKEILSRPVDGGVSGDLRFV